MNKLVTLLRVLYGLVFCLLGLNGFVSIIPVPPMNDQANSFLEALIATGYMMPLWKGVELLTGLALVFNLFIPLALTLLAPVLVNIFFFHAFLDQEQLFLPIVLTLIHLFLMIKNKSAYKSLLSLK